MATAKDLIVQIQDAILESILRSNREARRIFITSRRSMLESVRELWDAAANPNPTLDPETGNIRYVLREEAFKYGRFDKLDERIAREIASGRGKDVREVERLLVDTYNRSYNGAAWVYNQGYSLPIVGGARLRLVAQAVYSDFYGGTFDRFLDKHWSTYREDILGAVRRGLNQGIAYGRIANNITEITDAAYNRTATVARTEAGRVQSVADLDSIALLEEVGADAVKEWFKQANGPGRDNREDHFAMDGRQANDNGVFTLPSGAQGPAPRLTGQAGEDINCSCSLIKVIDGERPEERRVRDADLVPFDEFSQGKDVNVTDVRRSR